MQHGDQDELQATRRVPQSVNGRSDSQVAKHVGERKARFW